MQDSWDNPHETINPSASRPGTLTRFSCDPCYRTEPLKSSTVFLVIYLKFLGFSKGVYADLAGGKDEHICAECFLRWIRPTSNKSKSSSWNRDHPNWTPAYTRPADNIWSFDRNAGSQPPWGRDLGVWTFTSTRNDSPISIHNNRDTTVLQKPRQFPIIGQLNSKVDHLIRI